MGAIEVGALLIESLIEQRSLLTSHVSQDCLGARYGNSTSFLNSPPQLTPEAKA